MNSPDFLTYFSDYKLFDELLKRIKSTRDKRGKIFISPLYGAVESLLIRELSITENHLVVLTPDDKLAAEISVELEYLNITAKIILLTDFKPEALQEKLTELSKSQNYILISTYQLLNLQLPEKKEIERKTTKIEVGGDISYDDLNEYLNLMEYQRDRFVEAPGEFSLRGSIIDFWSYSEQNPVRLEFDGDFLESIRHFDPESQRSIEKVESATLASNLSQYYEDTDQTKYTDIFEYIENPLILASKYEIDNHKFSLENPFKKNKNPEETIPAELDDDIFPESGDEFRTQSVESNNLTVEFNNSASQVSAKTKFPKSSSWWNWGNSKVNMKINYTVKMPITNNLDVSNDYGNINLDKLEGHAKIDCDYGKITTKELMADDNIINFDYTNNSYFEYIKSGKINADYSGYTVGKTNSLTIVADYTKSVIEVAEDISYNCDYGGLTINKVNNVTGNGDNLNSKIGDVYKSIDMKGDYGSLKIKNLTDNAGNVDIESDYMKITIGYSSDYSFNFDIDLEHASLRGEDGFEITKQKIESGDKYYAGYFGNNNSGNTIKISSDYGSVTFNKN